MQLYWLPLSAEQINKKLKIIPNTQMHLIKYTTQGIERNKTVRLHETKKRSSICPYVKGLCFADCCFYQCPCFCPIQQCWPDVAFTSMLMLLDVKSAAILSGNSSSSFNFILTLAVSCHHVAQILYIMLLVWWIGIPSILSHLPAYFQCFCFD